MLPDKNCQQAITKPPSFQHNMLGNTSSVSPTALEMQQRTA
jgi:hypothetical protein